jgi:hypothetical protein
LSEFLQVQCSLTWSVLRLGHSLTSILYGKLEDRPFSAKVLNMLNIAL